MKKILIAVDGSEGSRSVVSAFRNLIRKPEQVILIHVERLEGDSLVIDMLGEAELSTLRTALKGTEHKEALDRASERILNFYKNELERDGVMVKTVPRDGAPSDEILKLAREETVDLIIMGYTCKSFVQRLLKGSASREVEKRSPVPVLVAKNGMCRQEDESFNRGSRAPVSRRPWGARLAKPSTSF